MVESELGFRVDSIPLIQFDGGKKQIFKNFHEFTAFIPATNHHEQALMQDVILYGASNTEYGRYWPVSEAILHLLTERQWGASMPRSLHPKRVLVSMFYANIVLTIDVLFMDGYF